MPSPQSILVALDFSPQSDAAVDDAFDLAVKFNAKVHLLHVFTEQGKAEAFTLSAHESDEARAPERAQLEAAAQARRASGHLGEVLWREGDPASTVVLTAQRQAVDLIVIGASGRTGLTRLRLGSVAQEVVKDSTCNVLVVRRAG